MVNVARMFRSEKFFFKVFFLAFASFAALSSTSQGQQPFLTDDADVTARHKLHFEFANEFDLLQRSSFPNSKQNTSVFTLNYGLYQNIEVGISSPLIAIFNAQRTSPRVAAGIGDTNFSIKYNFFKEQTGSRLPAMAVGLNIEIPTGDTDRQLGSGLADYWLNGILQKTLTEKTKLRLNTGILLSGNTTTGVIGIKSRGVVFTGALSMVRQFTTKLDLGVELTGAVTKNLQLGKGELQIQAGGNYSIRENCTLDFGIVGGKFAASPRVGVQLGFSIDF